MPLIRVAKPKVNPLPLAVTDGDGERERNDV